MKTRAIAVSILFVVSCQPRDKTVGEDDPGMQPGECISDLAHEEICDDNEDDDCDGFYDCEDSDCSGVGDCPICGQASLVEGEPLALPDDGTGTSAYVSTIKIQGFADDQTVQDVGDFKGVCVNMEHTWLRDLQIEMTAPSGAVVTLQQFLGREGGEVYMGTPNDDDTVDPEPGVGADYCWRPAATNPPMLDYCNESGAHDLPPSDYQASSGWAMLVGSPLNGDWTIRVTDLWSIDNGFIFAWGVTFNANLVGDCSRPID